MKIYDLVLNDYQFKKSFLIDKIQFKGNLIGKINPFRRKRKRATEEIIEQVQKIEVILKDPEPDKDYLKLKE